MQVSAEYYDISVDNISDDVSDMNDQSHFRIDADFKLFSSYKIDIERKRRALLNDEKVVRIVSSWHTMTTKKFEIENVAKTLKKQGVECTEEILQPKTVEESETIKESETKESETAKEHIFVAVQCL